MEKNKQKKKPYWLSRRLFAYAGVVTLATALFGALLLHSTTALVVQRKLERNCGHLLDLNTAAYEENLARRQGDSNYNAAGIRQELATFAVRVDACESIEELPDWDVMCRNYFSRYWLLYSNGRVARGEALPESLDKEEIGRLLHSGTWMRIGNMGYASITTSFGTLVSETKLYTAQSDAFATSGNNNEDNGFTFWVSEDGTLYGWPGGEPDGTLLAEQCTEAEALRTADGAVFTICGADYYCIAREMEDGSLLVAATARDELRADIVNETQMPILLFAAAALAVCLYALIMQEERTTDRAEWSRRKGGFYANRTLLTRLLAMCVGGTVFLVGLSWLTMTLASYAQHNQHAARYLRDIEESAPYYTGKDENEFFDFRLLCEASIGNLETAIAQQPVLAEPENLGRYADAITIRRVTIGGQEGDLNCLDARLYAQDGTLLVTGKDLLNGAKPGLSADVLEDLQNNGGHLLFYDTGNDCYCEIQRMVDGTERYVMLMLKSSFNFIGWLRDDGSTITVQDSDKFQLASTAAGLDMGANGRAFVISMETTASGKVNVALLDTMPDSYSVWIDESALVDFDVSNLREGYAGDQVIGGEHYYVNVASYQLPSQANEISNTSYWILYALPGAEVAQDRIARLARVGVTGFVLLLLLTLFGSVRFSAPPTAATASFTDRAERRTKTINGHRVNGPIMGWGTKSGWGAKTPEEKYSTALGNLAVVTTLLMVVIGAAQGSFGDGSLIRYIINGGWDKELNIFSCTYVVLVFLGCFIVSWVARGILGYVSGNLGPRSETMGRLFNSLIKYATYLAAGMYLLYDFGVNASVLLASAGLLTLVLSPTLNMLLGDVSAGIFIVFEDEYRVGDVVSINGFRGIVLEITLRTTHLEDMMGNVKVFNNSKITEVENLSQEYTTAVIQVAVQYEDSLDHIENVLRDELPKLAKIVPNVVGTPTYEGVDEFGDSGVVIRIHVIVREELRCPMERRFRHELKMMFDRRGINVPYPQVVLHEVLAESKAEEKPGAAENVPSGPATAKEN